jgi:hypothetical protein
MTYIKPLVDGTKYYAESADDSDLGVSAGIKPYSGIVGYGNKNKLVVNSDGSVNVNPKALAVAFDSVLTYPRGSDYTRRTSSANILPAAGKLMGIWVSSASATPTITIYDSATTTTTTTVLGVFTPASATTYRFPEIRVVNGIYIVISGTVDCTVFYDPTTT